MPNAGIDWTNKAANSGLGMIGRRAEIRSEALSHGSEIDRGLEPPIGRARCKGPLPESGVGQCAEHYYWHRLQARIRSHSGKDIQPIQLRHHDVQDHQIGHIGSEVCQRVFSACKRRGRIPQPLNQSPQQPGEILIVINDQNTSRGHTLQVQMLARRMPRCRKSLRQSPESEGCPVVPTVFKTVVGLRCMLR